MSTEGGVGAEEGGFWGKDDGVSFGQVKSGYCRPCKGGIKSSLGCRRGGYTKGARGLDGGALGTLALKGWAEEEQPPKDPSEELHARGKEGRQAGPGCQGCGGALTTECAKQNGVLTTHADSRIPPQGAFQETGAQYHKPLHPRPHPSQVTSMEVASELHSDKPWCVGSVRKEGRTSSPATERQKSNYRVGLKSLCS